MSNQIYLTYYFQNSFYPHINLLTINVDSKFRRTQCFHVNRFNEIKRDWIVSAQKENEYQNS